MEERKRFNFSFLLPTEAMVVKVGVGVGVGRGNNSYKARNLQGIEIGAGVYGGSAPDPLYPSLSARDAAALPAGCKQMDARLNMHGRRSDIVLRLRAARLGSGSPVVGSLENRPSRVSRPLQKELSGAFFLQEGASSSPEAS